jgi:hypothetical protein
VLAVLTATSTWAVVGDSVAVVVEAVALLRSRSNAADAEIPELAVAGLHAGDAGPDGEAAGAPLVLAVALLGSASIAAARASVKALAPSIKAAAAVGAGPSDADPELASLSG